MPNIRTVNDFQDTANEKALKIYRLRPDGYCTKAEWPDSDVTSRLAAGALLDGDRVSHSDGLSLGRGSIKAEGSDRPQSDFVETSIANLYLVSERARDIIRKKYGGIVNFFPVNGFSDPGCKYYAMVPKELIDGMGIAPEDISRRYQLPESDRILLIGSKTPYRFSDREKYSHIFRLRHNCMVGNENGKPIECYMFSIYVRDEFVRLIRENGLTGFDFVKEYDNTVSGGSREKIKPFAYSQPHSSEPSVQGKFVIPKFHEDGIFTADSLGQGTGEGISLSYYCGMISNSANRHIVYSINNCNMARDIEAAYSGGRLVSVYVNSGGVRTPVYMSFDFSSDSRPEGLISAVNACVRLCEAGLLEELKNAPSPMGSLSMEYYCDSEQMDINLQDSSCNIYSIGNAASDLLRCICCCVGEQCHEGEEPGFEVFDSIMMKLYQSLSRDIPERFEVTDDFKLYEPEMYD